MTNRENKLNEATSSPQDGAGVRDDRVRRLGRQAADAKDASSFGQAAPVCTENLIRVDDVMESLKLAE
jgi:hypothetical protein